MALRLADLSKPRTVSLGYGVTVTITGIGFTDLRTAEAMVYRQARREVEGALEAGDLASADPEAVAERETRIAARSEEIIFDRLATRHITAWTGVLLEDGVTPAPFNPETWAAFRDAMPFIADRIREEMRMPARLVVAEGKRLAALITWRERGGEAQCAGCAEDPAFACDRFGGQGACPRDTHALETEEAQALLEVLPFVWRQRRVSSRFGPYGLDIPACLEVIEAYGIDRRVAALLLPYAEAGWLRVIHPGDD